MHLTLIKKHSLAKSGTIQLDRPFRDNLVYYPNGFIFKGRIKNKQLKILHFDRLRLYLLRTLLRLVLFGLMVAFISYLLQQLPWQMGTPYDFSNSADNFTFIVEKESNQPMAPYLTNGIQS